MTPKNYSRKGYICTCTTIVFFDDKKIDEVKLKYEVEPNKSKKFIANPKFKWSIPSYWGNFKKVTELPPIFDKMTENVDYIIKSSTFLRDKILMPYVSSISITNKEKYETLKLQEERNKKLNKIKNI